jgi:hypothetical protein
VYVHLAVCRGLNVREPRKSNPGSAAEKRLKIAELSGRLFERMMKSLPMQDLAWFKSEPKPAHVLHYADFDSCATALGISPETDAGINVLRLPNVFETTRLESDRQLYLALRRDMIRMVEDDGFTPEELLRDISFKLHILSPNVTD